MSGLRQALLTRALGNRQENGDSKGLAGNREKALETLWKTARPIPTQHYWDVYFDRKALTHTSIYTGLILSRSAAKDASSSSTSENHTSSLQLIPPQISCIQSFWRYANNLPVANLRMRESLYLFKSGFKPIWEDRRNANGGSWTIRVSKEKGEEVWHQIQALAIGELFQSAMGDDDQLCGVGLSARFNAYLISVWHRDSSCQKSIDAIIAMVLKELTDELRPREQDYYYQKHQDRAGFDKELAAENMKKGLENKTP